MIIVLSGAGGFVGRKLGRLLAERHDVIAIVRQRGSAAEWATVEHVHDLTTPLDERSLPKRLDAVIHLAQSAHYAAFPEKTEDVLGVNVVSTARLLDYARRAKASSFLFTSTGGVYAPCRSFASEEDAVEPGSYYPSSKYGAELLVRSYSELFRTVVFRPFFIYGPGQSERMLVPRLIDRIRRGEIVTIDGPTGPRINPIFVGDAIEAFEPALEVDSTVINLAGDEVVTVGGLAAEIGIALGVESRIHHRPGPADEAILGDTRRMRNLLGVVPRVGLREGLERTVRAGSPHTA